MTKPFYTYCFKITYLNKYSSTQSMLEYVDAQNYDQALNYLNNTQRFKDLIKISFKLVEIADSQDNSTKSIIFEDLN